MALLSKIKPHSDAIDYFKELHFYNKPIEKPKAKRLKNIHQASREYAMPYKVEIIERKDPILQLEASKSSVKDLFSYF